MRSNTMNKYLQAAALAAAAFSFTQAAIAETVALTAQRATASLPDGSTVPMWGYCTTTAIVAGGPVSAGTCVAAVAPAVPGWTVGPTITVVAGHDLDITLSNTLPVPTSLVILGQNGGGLGNVTRAAKPIPHNGQSATTWPAVDNSVVFTPPAQTTLRALSFATETAAGTTVTPTVGTYHWANLKPGTYIYETGSRPSLQAPMGLYGTLIVTNPATAAIAAGANDPVTGLPVTPAVAAAAGDAYPTYTDASGVVHTTARSVPYDADAALLFSEIDPAQNAAVDRAATNHADELVTWTGDPASPCNTGTICYPPAVNYSPRFFLINGQAFDPTAPTSFAIPGDVTSGSVLLRLLNAGLRTHVPTVAGTTVALMAEDGNLAPGNPKIQSEVLLTAGKTYDVVLKPAQTPGTTAGTFVSPYVASTLAVFDRALHLTTNNTPFGGMQALIRINGSSATAGTPGGIPSQLTAQAINDVFTAPVNGTITGNVRANDFGVTTVTVPSPPTGLTIDASGNFSFAAGASSVTFSYYANGTTAASTSPIMATVTITVGGAAPTATAASFTSKVATAYTATHPGVLSFVTDPKNLALTAKLDAGGTCTSVDMKPDGSFTAVPAPGATSCTFKFHAVNSQAVSSGNPVDATVSFPTGSGIVVHVLDTQTRTPIATTDPTPGAPSDYSWVIEEDRMFQHAVDPTKADASNTLATSFHVSHMPLVASGCTGPRSCGDSNTVNGKPVTPRARTLPGDVALNFTPDATGRVNRYFLSVVPADASDGAAPVPADPAIPGSGSPLVVGHGMGGVSILAANAASKSVDVLTPRNPLPVANLSVFIFEDSSPTNGSVDEGESGLGGFQIKIFDVRGSSGDAAGEMTYDLAGMPLTNGLIGKPGCAKGYEAPPGSGATYAPTPVGTIYTCPNAPDRGPPPVRGNYSSQAKFLAALNAYNAQLAQDAIDYKLAGMALIPNMIPARVTVEAIPGASRATANEKWVQVSTLEGGKPVDTFVKAGEPAYWQEFGAPGFHSFIGFMNRDHVAAVTKSLGAKNTLKGVISSLHMDRPSAAKLNDSCTAATGKADAGCRAAFQYTQCYVALNTGVSGTGQNVAFTECDADGNFTLTNVPAGQHELVIWDQWLDQIIAKKAVSIPAPVAPATATTTDVGHIPVFSWFTRVEQSAFIDMNKNGVRDDGEPGIAQIPMTIRFRDGSVSNFLSTDGDGVAAADELFPLFNWYVIESDTTRYKGTGVNVVYDAGGKPDTAPVTFNDLNGKPVTKDYTGVLNSTETAPLTAVQQAATGAKYVTGKTVRIDPGSTLTEGLQGFINQTAIVDWGKAPYDANENGGITGLVYYASTRGFDDPRLEVQFSWEPAVPRVPVNLYAKVKNADGTVSLVKIDQTTTSSWDDNASNINCPGQAADAYTNIALGGNLQKCYDGQHVFNQVQPAPYDGRYRFPSAAYTAATAPTALAPYLNAKGNLIPGTYVVEVVPPAGYEIVKEEDKNILIGEPWNALGQTQFLGVGNLFILPDQAVLNDSNIAGAGLAFPACVGAPHTVPDYLTLFSDNNQLAPYAGADRPLCDRKEVNLADQTQVNADFQVFTPTPVAAHFVGIMLNDAAAEFDPISPSFGEKAALPNAPISIRDFNGVEISRTYNDKWGSFNGLTPSTLAVNVPNPSGYSPNMLTSCMNDPGPIPDPTGALDPATGKVKMIIDPMYNPMFSNFCYVWPYMPGSTVYLDTPVLPTAAFASASTYQPVDCQYPDATPAVKRVDGAAGHGPWVLAADTVASGKRKLTITSLGVTDVLNPAYSGPTATLAGTTTPKTKRTYNFGSKGTVVLRSTVAGVTTDTPLANVVWGDAVITGDVPDTLKAGYSGELLITNGDSHRTSVDAVTVSVESVTPVVVSPSSLYAGDPTAPDSLNYPQPVQTAIDKANPGDLIILEAGHYPELVVMWKPVRLQGVGAASVVINATKFPNRKVADWRGRINALFGVDPIADTLDPKAQVDALPGQTLTGGIVQLEPTVLATEEGAGITVIASDDSLKANNCPRNGFVAGQGPVVTVDASGATTPDTVPLVTVTNANRKWSNFTCARSSIDGLSVTGGDSGGGIYVNGWAHGLQIANNRVFGNAGPFSGGVRIGQPYLEGAVNGGINSDGTVLGYNNNVSIHHNSITTNGMVEGNAAAGATAAGGAGGGLSLCSGTDNYKVNYNFICGNFASSDGGGIGHIGLSNNGSIAFNQVIFNESYNQTSPQNGGGIIIEGETSAGGAVSEGSGNVTIDANVIQGNFARAGSGGGLRLQDTNGTDIPCGFNNDRCARGQKRPWVVTVTNNIIVDNLSGSAGGGISLYDTFGALINNNTVAANDSTGIAGNLFSTTVNNVSTGPTTGVPGPAGIVTEPSSPQLLRSLPLARQAAYTLATPVLVNNIVYQNRSFFFDVRASAATLIASNNWQDALNHTGSPLGAQSATGECVNGGKYWDMGVLGDRSPTAPGTGTTGLHPTYSVLTPETLPLYAGLGNKSGGATPANLFAKLYCNGSRVLPGVQFEPGTPFQPDFQLDAAATLDESGNFVDLHFGPISLGDPLTGVTNGDYHLPNETAPAYNAGIVTDPANTHDVDNNGRPRATPPAGTAGIDVGADQYTTAAATLLPNPLAFGSQIVNTTSAVQTVTYSNTGSTVLGITGVALAGTSPGNFAIAAASNTCTIGLSLQPGDTCSVGVTFTPASVAGYAATIQVTASGGVSVQTANLTGTGIPAAVVQFSWGNDQAVGSWANNGGTRNIRVTNIGPVGAASLDFTALPSVTGAQFTLSAVQPPLNACTSTTKLARNASCLVAVTRTRPAAIPRSGSGTLTITDTGATTPTQTAVTLTQTLNLSGT